MPDVIEPNFNFLNPFDVIYRLRLTNPCPVDLDALYDDCVHKLDTTDWRQANLAMCLDTSPMRPKQVHFEVDDKIFWAEMSNVSVRPSGSMASFHIPHIHDQFGPLLEWIAAADLIDERCGRMVGIIDMNVYQLRGWRQVKRHWPEFAKCLLACMSERQAKTFVQNVYDRTAKAMKRVHSTRLKEKMVAKKPRERVVNAIQAGLLLPDQEIQAWAGYYNSLRRTSRGLV